MQTITFKFTAIAIALSSLFGVIGCEKEDEDPFDDFRRSWPIPTELPDITCEGAHTLGCDIDSILFVAHFFPNTSSYGSDTPEGGIKAYTLSQNNHDIVIIEGKHPLRPAEIDERWMNLLIWYSISGDSLELVKFTKNRQITNLISATTRIDQISMPSPVHSLTYDPDTKQLCGTIENADLAVYEPTPGGAGPVYRVVDTIPLRNLRVDVIAREGWYP